MAPERSSDSDALSGRGAAIGYLIGFAVAMCAITAVGTIGGLGFGPSVGLGAFVGPGEAEGSASCSEGPSPSRARWTGPRPPSAQTSTIR
jgi:hypothetical protein